MVSEVDGGLSLSSSGSSSQGLLSEEVCLGCEGSGGQVIKLISGSLDKAVVFLNFLIVRAQSNFFNGRAGSEATCVGGQRFVGVVKFSLTSSLKALSCCVKPVILSDNKVCCSSRLNELGGTFSDLGFDVSFVDLVYAVDLRES